MVRASSVFPAFHDFGRPSQQVAAIKSGHFPHQLGAVDQRRNGRVDVGGRRARNRVDDGAVVGVVDVQFVGPVDPFSAAKHLHRRTVFQEDFNGRDD